jgi:hypothetical protein
MQRGITISKRRVGGASGPLSVEKDVATRTTLHLPASFASIAADSAAKGSARREASCVRAMRHRHRVHGGGNAMQAGITRKPAEQGLRIDQALRGLLNLGQIGEEQPGAVKNAPPSGRRTEITGPCGPCAQRIAQAFRPILGQLGVCPSTTTMIDPSVAERPLPLPRRPAAMAFSR